MWNYETDYSCSVQLQVTQPTLILNKSSEFNPNTNLFLTLNKLLLDLLQCGLSMSDYC